MYSTEEQECANGSKNNTWRISSTIRRLITKVNCVYYLQRAYLTIFLYFGKNKHDLSEEYEIIIPFKSSRSSAEENTSPAVLVYELRD